MRVTASDNRAALIRLSRDPLTLHATRLDTMRGLVDLMDAALAAAPRSAAGCCSCTAGKDELVPPRAIARDLARAAAGPAGPRIAYYPDDYHLMLRDLEPRGADRGHRGLDARPGRAACRRVPEGWRGPG